MDALPQVGAARAWLQAQYGGAFQELETFPATGVSNASAIGNDPGAVFLLFTNIGAFDIFLKLRADIPATTGIRLGANGGGTSMTVKDDATLPTREWFAASPGGASQLYILRLVLFGTYAPSAQGGKP